MPDHAISIATLVFACMAGVGSLVRCYQNLLMYRLHKRIHASPREARPPETGENGSESNGSHIPGNGTPERHDASSCVHEWFRSWSGRCEGCLVSPISRSVKRLEETFDREG
jgi:hypothetical protein